MKLPTINAILIIALCATMSCSIPTVHSDERAHRLAPGLIEKARISGTIRVIVQLDIDEHRSQQELDKAKDELLAQLKDTPHKVSRRLEFFPTIVLEVGLEALTILGASDLVRTVREDQVGSLLHSSNHMYQEEEVVNGNKR